MEKDYDKEKPLVGMWDQLSVSNSIEVFAIRLFGRLITNYLWPVHTEGWRQRQIFNDVFNVK